MTARPIPQVAAVGEPPLAPGADSVGSVRAFVAEAEGMCTLHLLVEGVTCAACIHAIEARLGLHPEVVGARLNLSLRRLHLRWRGERGRADTFTAEIEALGYRVAPFDPQHLVAVDAEGTRELLRALGIAGFASTNVMMLALAIWVGQAGDMPAATQSFLQWLSALVTLPAVAVAGRPFYRSAWQALRAGRTNIDVPIALGLVLTAAISLAELMRGGRDVYFDSAAALLFVLLLGRLLDARVRARARAAVEQLLMVKAHGATVCRPDGSLAVVQPEAVEPGMVVLVRPGERIPVDATVLSGRSEIDTAIVTGESVPRSVTTGASVLAGCINGSGALRIQAERGVGQSHLAEIVRLVERAQEARGPAVTLADRVARVWTPVIHAIALATFLGWIVAGSDLPSALLHAVSVLIIACPCAIGLAVPAVQVVALGALMRRGILVRSGDALERLAAIDRVAFDKTGTLSWGEPVLRSGFDDRAALTTAAALAAASTHPLARALVRAAAGGAPPDDVVEHPGDGLSLAGKDGVVRLGRRSFCSVGTVDAEAGTEMWLTRPGAEPVRFAFDDPPRPDAARVIAGLRARSLRLALVTGDRRAAAERFAASLGLTAPTDLIATELMPAGKAACLTSWCEDGGRALMVGDGVNDAPALAAAHASASFAHGAPVSQNAADAVLPSGRLDAVPDLLTASRKSLRLIRQNLVLAALYNVALIPLAILGLVTPLVAALAMSASSLTVTLNALRAGRWASASR